MQDEYISCSWLEGGLSFNKNTLHHCCLPNISKEMKEPPAKIYADRKGWPFICSYEGGTLPVEEILKSREALVSKLNNGEETPCSDCIFLQKKRWSRTETLFDYAILFSPYTLCNLRCSYCNFVKDDDCKMYFPLLPVLNQLAEEKYMSPETTTFCWAGGEPTMLEELSEEYDLISHRVKRITFHTNAIAFSKPIYHNLGNKNTGEIFIKSSIDAGTPEMYKKVRGKDFFNRVFNNLQKYAEKAPQNVFAKYIVLSENCSLHEVQSFITQVINCNIKRVILSSDYTCWDIPNNHWTALEALFDGLKSQGIDVVFTHHLMSVISTTNAEKVPKILYSGFMDHDCPTCWPSDGGGVRQDSDRVSNHAGNRQHVVKRNVLLSDG